MSRLAIICMSLCFALLTGCAAQQTHRTIDAPTVNTYNSSYSGPRAAIVVGDFDNRSDYARGLFSSGTDRLASQAKTVLKTHLQQTNRFSVLDRDNMQTLQSEAERSGATQSITGAKFVISGNVTEFGRKAIGDKQLFGLLGKGKSQIAQAKVTLNIVDVTTSEIVYSVQGAGEYSLSEREVIGFGSTARYDATLNGKVLDLAIREVVNKLVTGIENGAWKI